MPGEFVFGRVKAAAELKMTEKQIRTCLTALKTAGNVAIKTASKYSVITIVNWHTYQYGECEIGQQSGQEGASNGPATGHRQEVKDLKKPLSAPSFDAFWNAYPRKIGKAQALKAWQKIAPDDSLLQQILNALGWQSESPAWTKDGGAFVPHASTWLNGRRWEDERPVTSEKEVFWR